MPSAPVETLFDVKDFKLDNKMLGHLAQMCTPDLPVNNTSLVGDFAFSEICISDDEAIQLMDIVLGLRTADHAEFMVQTFGRINQQAAEKKNKVMAALGESIENEYVRLCKIFFLRSRCMRVSRASTNQVIGRIISFPDQVSDDYGNNLEPRGEKGMNPTKVAEAERSAEQKRKTVFLGHGQGATMAQICACLFDAQCVVFDGTFVSEILVQSFFRNKLPENVKMEPRQCTDRSWNVFNESLEIVEKRFAAAVPAALAIAQQVAEEQAAKKAEEAKKKKEEEAAKGKAQPAKTQEEGKEDEPSPAELAAAYFAKRVNVRVTGVIPQGPVERFQLNGKFPASALSNVLSNPMNSTAPAAYPYTAPAKKAAAVAEEAA